MNQSPLSGSFTPTDYLSYTIPVGQFLTVYNPIFKAKISIGEMDIYLKSELTWYNRLFMWLSGFNYSKV